LDFNPKSKVKETLAGVGNFYTSPLLSNRARETKGRKFTRQYNPKGKINEWI
jgi:hypothetical protein